jgi:ribonuclease D
VHGIDVETAGNNGGGALTPEEGSLRLVQISDGRQTDIYDAFLDDAEVIRKAIESREELVAHNAVFERLWLKHALGIDRPDLHDTMIMSQVLAGGTRASLNKSSGHSLQAVAKRELKKEMSKEEQDSEWGAPELSPEQLRYAAYDALVMLTYLLPGGLKGFCGGSRIPLVG